MIYVAVYLAAIVAANLSVAYFGPQAVIWNAFLLIGLDLTTRDRLHDKWGHNQLVLRMGLLIATGGAISYILNRDAAQIALASTVAFAVAAILDTIVYAALHGRPWFQRVQASNIVAAAADSILFPTLAFGSFLPLIVLGQFVAKVAGGFLWSLILRPRRKFAEPEAWEMKYQTEPDPEAAG